jgi:hypothetical protein
MRTQYTLHYFTPCTVASNSTAYTHTSARLLRSSSPVPPCDGVFVSQFPVHELEHRVLPKT